VKHWKDVAEKAKQEVVDRDKQITSQNLALEGYSERVKKLAPVERLGDALRELIGPIPTTGSANSGVSDIQVEHEVGNIEVTHTRKTVKVDTTSALGRIALLFSEGAFKVGEQISLTKIKGMFDQRGWGWSNNIGKEAMLQLAESGFFEVKPAGKRSDWAAKISVEEATRIGILKVKEVIEG
jgi:hypothetical protein